ncbi:hypothetical protein C5S29_05535 [ANME-1 cluster archaeon GoMg3.2]|nr:hypothetical protein [ANME-1 cluster archaeon GoMg3.2]
MTKECKGRFLKMSFVPIQQTFMIPMILEEVMIILATLSSANRVPAGIYKVEGGGIKEIFRDEKEPITGLVYEDGALYYANYGTKIYRLNLTTGEQTVVYSNPERMWLSDVGFRQGGIG